MPQSGLGPDAVSFGTVQSFESKFRMINAKSLTILLVQTNFNSNTPNACHSKNPQALKLFSIEKALRVEKSKSDMWKQSPTQDSSSWEPEFLECELFCESFENVGISWTKSEAKSGRERERNLISEKVWDQDKYHI